jgi:DNA uptake protein ComE-like DNA-binding protein
MPRQYFLYLFADRVMKWLYNLVTFSRQQSNGLVVLITLVLLLIFSEPLYRNLLVSSPPPPNVVVPDSTQVKSVQKQQAVEFKSEMPRDLRVNPNTARYADWLALQLEPSVAARIVAYRNKGGSFTYREDLLKIYGLDSATYLRIANYIQLPARPKPHAAAAAVAPPLADLNAADSAQLIRVYGIGPVRAQRLLRYRTALGGFISWEQLYEVYGLDSAVVSALQQKFFISPSFVPRKININNADVQQLAAHPYISTDVARAIVTYRMQHGNFNAPADIQKIVRVSEATFNRLKPYLTVE